MRPTAGFLTAMLIGWLLVAVSPTATGEQDDTEIFGQQTDDDFVIEARYHGEGNSSGASSSEAAGGTTQPVVEYKRGIVCAVLGGWTSGPFCPGSAPRDGLCPDGSIELKPLFAREQKDDGTWTRWEMVTSYTCPDNTDELLAAVLHEWSTLTPDPTMATVQPDTGWVYANVPTIALADDQAQVHTSTLLGAQVDIRATPERFTWVWGDGEQTVTEDPGSPYPDATVTHTYAHQEGVVMVDLETEWSGQYRVDGGSWTDFGASITSESPPIELEVRNPHSRLVACTTDGRCR